MRTKFLSALLIFCLPFTANAAPAEPDGDAERLAAYGKTELEPPEREPADALELEIELLDGDTAAHLDTAWRGHRALFARTRLQSEGGDERVLSQGASALLDEMTLDPMAAHTAALADQSDLDLQVDLRVEKDAESGELVVRESLLFRGRTPEPAGAPDLDTPVSADTRLAAARAKLTATDDPVKVDAERFLIYATFNPRVPADAPSRVDWLAPQESRKEAMKAAERQRQAEISRLLRVSEERLEALDHCELLHGTRAAHAAYLACTPAQLLDLARDASFVRELDIISLGEAHGMRGDDLRANDGNQLDQFLLRDFKGERNPGGGRSNVEVALLDGHGFYLAWQHPAFDDSANGPSRMTKHVICNSAGNCPVDNMSGSDGFKHGARSMIGAFSDVLSGQDPNVTSTADRQDRSHGAYEAELELYHWIPGGAEPGLINAADPTIDDSVDIAQMSWGVRQCDPDSTYAAWRDAWDFAYSHGTFGVISAGNAVNRTNDDCTTNSWATRADLLVVGAFGDNVGININGKPATPIANWDYDTQPLMGWHWTDLNNSSNCSGTGATCWSSAIGGAQLRFASGSVLRARSVVDVVAPSGRELGAQMNGPANSATAVYTTQCCGTSMAAPHAAAVAVSLKDWAVDNEYSTFNDPGIMHVNMLLMGDGTHGTHNHDPGGFPTSSTVGMDRLWGAGRLKARLFNSEGLDNPWAWGTGSFYIYDGDTVDVPIGSSTISSDVDAWTGAFAWDEPHLDPGNTNQAAADIVMQVVTTSPVGGQCVNPNGGSATVVSSDYSFDVAKRIRLRPGRIESLWGKCAWMRFRAFSIPDGPDGFDRRFVHRADYWEDLDRESWEGLTDVE